MLLFQFRTQRCVIVSVPDTHVVASVPDTDMLPWLLSEFPFLYLSPETVHDLWRKSSRQLELLSRAETDVKHRKSKAQVEVD